MNMQARLGGEWRDEQLVILAIGGADGPTLPWTPHVQWGSFSFTSTGWVTSWTWTVSSPMKLGASFLDLEKKGLVRAGGGGGGQRALERLLQADLTTPLVEATHREEHAVGVDKPVGWMSRPPLTIKAFDKGGTPG